MICTTIAHKNIPKALALIDIFILKLIVSFKPDAVRFQVKMYRAKIDRSSNESPVASRSFARDDSWQATVDPGSRELGRISFGRDLGSQHRHGALSPVTTFHSTEGHVRCHVFCA